MQCGHMRCNTLRAAHNAVHAHTQRRSCDRWHTTASNRGQWRIWGTPGASLSPRASGLLRIRFSPRSSPPAPADMTHALRYDYHAHAHENGRHRRLHADAMLQGGGTRASCIPLLLSLYNTVSLYNMHMHMNSRCSFQSWSAMRCTPSRRSQFSGLTI